MFPKYSFYSKIFIRLILVLCLSYNIQIKFSVTKMHFQKSIWSFEFLRGVFEKKNFQLSKMQKKFILDHVSHKFIFSLKNHQANLWSRFFVFLYNTSKYFQTVLFVPFFNVIFRSLSNVLRYII